MAGRLQAAEKAGLRYVGLNIAGGEFGAVPGRYGHDYVLPDRGDLAWCARLGFNTVRVPFLWERIQPAINGPLSAAEHSRLLRVVEHAAQERLSIILDLHNYGARRLPDDGWSKAHVIGSDRLPVAAFSDVWARLAKSLAGSNEVMIGLMNEPHSIEAARWVEAASQAIRAIRTAGASQTILVPGTAFTGAHSWMSSGNTLLSGIVDPSNNFLIEVHQYLDRDSSGTSPEAVSPTIGSQRVSEFEEWARAHRMKAFLGEFAGADNETAIAALDDLCRRMSANPDVWVGWTAWAAGPWWPDTYHFRLAPKKDGRLPGPLRTLIDHARRVTG